MTRRDERPRAARTDAGAGDGTTPDPDGDTGDPGTLADAIRRRLSRDRLFIVTGTDGRLRAVRANRDDDPDDAA